MPLLKHQERHLLFIIVEAVGFPFVWVLLYVFCGIFVFVAVSYYSFVIITLPW